MTSLAGTNRRAPDPHPISINIQRLFRDTDDDNNRTGGRDLGFPNVVARTERRKWGLLPPLRETGGGCLRRDRTQQQDNEQ